MREAFELDGPDRQPVKLTLKRTGAKDWVNHIILQADVNQRAEAAARFEGNRRARRKAVAQAGKGVSENPAPVEPDTIRPKFPVAE